MTAITGTYPPRLPEMLDAMRNLRASTYPNLEHCIAVEGDNRAEVHETVFRIKQEAERLGCADSTHVVGLGRWWSRFIAASISAVPFQVAQWMASGDYLMWFSDDERATPDHVESLVDLLEATDSDFVYPRVEIHFSAQFMRTSTDIIGSDPPVLGGVSHALYRAELLDYRGFEHHVGSGTDWDQIRHWIEAGARWAMLPRVTLTHRADKMGEGPDFNQMQQPLRGHTVRSAG